MWIICELLLSTHSLAGVQWFLFPRMFDMTFEQYDAFEEYAGKKLWAIPDIIVSAPDYSRSHVEL
jgi:hypothetical protein